MHRGLAIVLAVLIMAIFAVLPAGYASGLSVTPTPTPQAEDDLGQICQEAVDAWQALVPSDLPQHLMANDAERSPSDFDVNTVFEVFDRLSLPEGIVLDYVYYYDGMGGFPILYTRPADQKPYLTPADLPDEDGTWPSFIENILIEDTPAGYVQFALFEMLAPQFYIFWHAGYGQRDITCDDAARDDIIEQASSGDFGMAMEQDAAVAARKLDVTPTVTVDEESDFATVEIVYFSYWGGFVREKISIQRSTPRPMVETTQEVLVPYESGIMF